MSGNVRLRSTQSADNASILAAFISGRPELALLPGQLAALQLHAQRAHFAATYPTASEQLILVDEVFVGRCAVARTPSAIRLLDISVLESHRNKGFGTAVTRALIDQAAAASAAFRLSVWHENVGACRLYERLGLRPYDRDSGYLHLELTAPVPSGAVT